MPIWLSFTICRLHLLYMLYSILLRFLKLILLHGLHPALVWSLCCRACNTHKQLSFWGVDKERHKSHVCPRMDSSRSHAVACPDLCGKNCQGHVSVQLDQHGISSESQLFCSSLPCIYSVYLPLFTLRYFLLCVFVSSSSILHEDCTVHGSAIEVSGYKAIDAIRASLAGKPSYMIFEISKVYYLLTGFPHFLKSFRFHVLLLASYHYSPMLHFP